MNTNLVSHTEATYSIKSILKDLSSVCLCASAGWALYRSNYLKHSFLYGTMAAVFVHGLFGIMRNHNQYFRNKTRTLFHKCRIFFSTIPISMLNTQILFNLNLNELKRNTYLHLATAALPIALEILHPNQNERILDMIVLSNVCSLGFRSLAHSNQYGVVAAIWQSFYYFVTINAENWFNVSREIPFNFGLSGLCIFSVFCLEELIM